MDDEKKEILDVLQEKKTIQVGSNISKEDGGWSFDNGTYLQFDEHITNSIPGYKNSHEIIVQLADHFVRKEAVVYDLGCSTGTLTRMLGLEYRNRNPKIIGIDTVSEMVEQCKTEADTLIKAGINLEYLKENIINFEVEKADLITSVFTMQFIHLSDRQKVIKKIYDALYPGGTFIWLENKSTIPRLQDIINNAYMKFSSRASSPMKCWRRPFPQFCDGPADKSRKSRPAKISRL